MYNKTLVILYHSILFIPIYLGLSVASASAQTMWMLVHEEDNKVILDPAKEVQISQQVSVSPSRANSSYLVSYGNCEIKGWRRNITATIFWIGEKACRANPVHNKASSWDMNWVRNFGGVDTPYSRAGYYPKKFTPKMNPFYIALPYNDIAAKTHKHKSEVSKVIWWYDREFKNRYLSICKGRWIAIKFGDKVCYAQWEDCGPFVTNDWEYVFQGKRPKKNRNQNAGIDLSPAIRDYLKLKSGQQVSWRFVEDFEVEQGPWSKWLRNSSFLSKNP